MTTQDFNKAFEFKFKKENLNFRTFENDDINIRVTIEKVDDDDYRITIEHFFEDIADEYFHADTEKTIAFINEKNLELQDYSDAQQFEMEIAKLAESTTDEDLNPIKETTYTCKNGYVMHVFLIEEWFFDTFPTFNQYYLDKKVKSLKGWYDYKQKGIILRSLRDAENVVNFIKENDYKPIERKLRMKYRY